MRIQIPDGTYDAFGQLLIIKLQITKKSGCVIKCLDSFNKVGVAV